MAVVATLDVILAAKTAQFNKDMQNVPGALNKVKRQAESPAMSFDIGNIGGSLRSMTSLAGPAGIAIGAAFAGATAAIAGAGLALSKIHEEMNRIDEISDSAQKLGLSFAELETLRQSLSETSGLGFEAVEASLQRFQLGLSEAARTGKGDVFDSLAAAGLNAADLIKMGPVAAMQEVMAATSQMKNPTDQLAIAFELFGKQGAQLVTSLREGPDALDNMAVFAKQTGLALSQAQAEQVGAANDAFARMENVAVGAWRQISAEAAPVLTVIYESVTDIGVSFGGWQQTLPMIVDTGAQFAGLMYDIFEVATLTHKTLYNISKMDFSQVGEDLKAAMDFSTGDKFQQNIQAARDRAKEEAAKKDQFRNFGSESALAEYEQKKQQEKELAELRKKEIEDQVAYEKKLYDEFLANKKKDEDKAHQLALKYDPMLQLRETLSELDRLKEGGLISGATFDKAAMDAAKQATPEYKGAVSAQKDSVEAYRLIVDRENQNNQQTQMKNIAQSSLEVLKRIEAKTQTIKAAR